MSTTVTYKGNTLTTVSNATKTLKTAGKYMEGDVILTDTSAGAATIESLSIAPSETAQTFNASTVDGYKPVTVGAISSTYVGSGIDRRSSADLTNSLLSNAYRFIVPAGYYAEKATKNIAKYDLPTPTISINDETGVITATSYLGNSGFIDGATKTATEQLTLRDSDDLTASGATVTAPAGYYSAAASKSVATMTLPTSAASSATSGYTNKATIGRSTTAQYINIPPGYNSTGAYYVISAVANGSATAPASISGTAASVSTGTNTLTLTKTVSVTPTVSAGYVSSGTAGNSSVSLTASVTTKAAATITPTTTNQTIAAGTYLTGTQTIAGDADLVGSNILSTANIFGVQGTVDFIDVYIRSAAPTSSVGNDGDIYIQE